MQLVKIDEKHQSDTAEKILDVATQVFLEFGYKRTSVDYVAKKSGISRVTVYRHFSDKEALFQAILMRDLASASTQIESKLSKLATTENPVVAGFVMTVLAARKHPLIQRFMETEPEWLTLHMTVEGKSLFQFTCATAAAFLKQDKFKGWLNEDNLDLLAEVLIRLLFSAVLTPGGYFASSPKQLEKSVSTLIGSFLVRKH